jgi:electron transport complex protein RnfG
MENNFNNNNNNGNSKNMKNKTGFTDKILRNRYYPLVFLIIIVFVAVSLVMVLSNVTKDKILAEREAVIISRLKVIYPDIDDYNFRDEYYEIYTGGAITGFAFIAKGRGYGGEINILVGINTDYAIKKITIIANTETPGLGTKISENFFIDQFAGLSSHEISLAKDGGKIDAITGATISSRAVVDAVRNDLETMAEKIKGGQK